MRSENRENFTLETEKYSASKDLQAFEMLQLFENLFQDILSRDSNKINVIKKISSKILHICNLYCELYRKIEYKGDLHLKY